MSLIVPLTEDHLDAVAAIEEADGDVHWSRLQFERELSEEICRFFVIVDEQQAIQAYGGYRKAGPEAQITNLVVRKDQRCKGFGKRLLGFLIDCAKGEACTIGTLEVRAGNPHAQALYKALGFKVSGGRPKLYKDPIEDAILMEKPL